MAVNYRRRRPTQLTFRGAKRMMARTAKRDDRREHGLWLPFHVQASWNTKDNSYVDLQLPKPSVAGAQGFTIYLMEAQLSIVCETVANTGDAFSFVGAAFKKNTAMTLGAVPNPTDSANANDFPWRFFANATVVPHEGDSKRTLVMPFRFRNRSNAIYLHSQEDYILRFARWAVYDTLGLTIRLSGRYRYIEKT